MNAGNISYTNRNVQIQFGRLTKELLEVDISSTSKTEAEKIVVPLKELINYHDYRYYSLNNPVVSDYEYDKLFSLLKAIEEKWPQLQMPDSPTQRIPGGITKEFFKIKHLTPMLSLDNSYNKEDIIGFDKRVKLHLKSKAIEYTVEPKFDGAGISIVYENDLFVRGVTRGDGIEGEDITNNLKLLRSIPLKAAFSKFGIYKIEIRGEVLMPKETLKILNKERAKEGETVFANPRNAAAGSLRLQNQQQLALRKLEAFVYQISYAVNNSKINLLKTSLNKQDQNIKMLNDLGFNSSYHDIRKSDKIEEIINYCTESEKGRDSLPYETDGVVIKVNDISKSIELGYTSHHPRWALAFKFKPRQATTKLIDVEFHVGKTGIITPVAKLEPVPVSGVIISSATLHNEAYINEHDFHYGDTVLIERAGDVIPYIVKPIIELRPRNARKIIFPTQCPSCHSKLYKGENEASWKCLNINCPGQVLELLIHFCYAMNIEGLGEKTISLFFEKGIIKNINDIFSLPYGKISELEGFKEKSITNLKQAVEEAKKRPVEQLIAALSIRYIGWNTAIKVSKSINDISELYYCSANTIKDIGSKAAESLCSFFSSVENISALKKLKALGVNTSKRKQRSAVNKKLEGLKFVFTGKLKKYTRQKAKSIVETLGGQVKDTISSDVDYLIVGEDAGAKLQKVNSSTTKIISEEEFNKLISR